MKHLFFSFVFLCAFSATTFADGPIPQPPGQPRPYSLTTTQSPDTSTFAWIVQTLIRYF